MNNKTLYEIYKSPYWKDLKDFLEEEIDKITDWEKVSSWEEVCGVKICRKWFKEIIRKVESSSFDFE